MTDRMSADEFRKGAAKHGTDKGRVRGTKRIVVNGEKFDSKREYERWLVLKDMEKAGEIGNLQRQIRIPLWGKEDMIRTATGLQMHYVADFGYFDNKLGVYVYEDAKGWPTDVYKMKKAILLAMGQEIKEV